MENYKRLWDESKGWLIGGSIAILVIYMVFTIPPKLIDSDVDCYEFVGSAVTGLREEPNKFAAYREIIFESKKDGYISMEECSSIRELSENIGKRKLVFQ